MKTTASATVGQHVKNLAAVYYTANLAANKAKAMAEKARKDLANEMQEAGVKEFSFKSGDHGKLSVAFSGRPTRHIVNDKLLAAVGHDEFMKVASVSVGTAEEHFGKLLVDACVVMQESAPNVQVKAVK